MHTLKIKTDEFGNVCVNHNGDWSGEVFVSWRDEDDVEKRVELPGKLLLTLGGNCAAESLRSTVINAVEGWTPRALLGIGMYDASDTESVTLPRLAGTPSYVPLIKAVREATGASLSSAKGWVDCGATINSPSQSGAGAQDLH